MKNVVNVLYMFSTSPTAMRNSQGDYILNGDFQVIQYQRQIKLQGGYLEYSGSDTNVERINSTKKIEEDITVLVRHLTLIGYYDIRLPR